jgi:hypothetical protein
MTRKNLEERPVFDSAWRAVSEVSPCSISSVSDFIMAHYLHKRPAIVLLCLALTVKGETRGVIVFSAPPIQTEKRFGGVTWELARLWIDDHVPMNAETFFIGKAVKFVSRHAPQVKYLVSYADPSAGHRGTIYRAANWTFDGMTDGDRTTPRQDYVDLNTGKKYGRKGNMPATANLARQPRVSKMRFVMRIGK